MYKLSLCDVEVLIACLKPVKESVYRSTHRHVTAERSSSFECVFCVFILVPLQEVRMGNVTIEEFALLLSSQSVVLNFVP